MDRTNVRGELVESNKIDDVPKGKAECYWCSRVLDISAMRPHSVSMPSGNSQRAYVCSNCGL